MPVSWNTHHFTMRGLSMMAVGLWCWVLAGATALVVVAPAAFGGVARRACLWPEGQRRALRVRFLDGEAATIARVKALAELWTAKADVRFVWVDDGPAEIRVSFAKPQGWSVVGRCSSQREDEPTMMLGLLSLVEEETMRAETVLHEFGHALGLEHEHQSPLSEIEWDRERVYESWEKGGGTRAAADALLFSRFPLERVEATAYDRDSVMGYVLPGSWGQGLRSDSRATPSEGDLAFLSRLYPAYEVQVVRTVSFDQPGWSLLALTDLDGDKRVDAWLRSDGDARVFRAVGVEDGRVIQQLMHGPEARFLGTHDVDGDGWGEMLWRTRSGRNVQAMSVGKQYIRASDLGGTTPIDRVIGAGDWDRDGVVELLVGESGVSDTAWWVRDAKGWYRRGELGGVGLETVDALQAIDALGGLVALGIDPTTRRVVSRAHAVGTSDRLSAKSWPFVLPTEVRLVGLADVSGDGSLDAVYQRGQDEVGVCLGEQTPCRHLPVAVGGGGDRVFVALVDLDRDGSVELVTRTGDGPILVHRAVVR